MLTVVHHGARCPFTTRGSNRPCRSVDDCAIERWKWRVEPHVANGPDLDDRSLLVYEYLADPGPAFRSGLRWDDGILGRRVASPLGQRHSLADLRRRHTGELCPSRMHTPG